MLLKEEATGLVRQALARQVDVLILRGVDEHAREGGDIDVLVPRNKSRLALHLTAETAAEASWKIVAIRDIGYLAQICLTKRCDTDGQYHAIKIDFFNGVSWCALGKDPLFGPLFEIRKSGGEDEAVGLTTLLQKLLYAGYLRKRDRERITSVCGLDRIESFISANGLPLTRSKLERGALSKMTRWRLRAASSGVSFGSLPAWLAQVVWRRIRFGFLGSTIPGTVIVVEGNQQERLRAVASRFRLLFEQAGFQTPTIACQNGADGSKAARHLRIAWHAVRGETLLTCSAMETGLTRGTLGWVNSMCVRLIDLAPEGEDDLDTLLASVSQHTLNTLRQIENQ